MAEDKLISSEQLYNEIKEALLYSRQQAYTAVNFAMVQAYWQIGKIIVEHENNGGFQMGNRVPEFESLAARLAAEFGKGFSVRTLYQMRKFYVLFPSLNALRSQLEWYMNEAVESGWSSRQLERQISTMYYERLLASRDKVPVKAEAKDLLAAVTPEKFIKDPYVLEFLDLKDYPSLHESDLEQALIDKLQEFLLELGRGFCFVARQKMMRYEDEDFYLDLVFYHSVLKCRSGFLPQCSKVSCPYRPEDWQVDTWGYRADGQLHSYV